MTSEKIVRTYLIIAGLYTLSASLIWGVNTLFLLDAGLSIQQVFIANASFSAAMAIFEIPTGVLADTRGRRVSFLLSVAILILGTLGYVGAAAVGGSLFLFIVMSIIMGLGFTFYSGAMEAWLVDALTETGYAGGLDQVFARSSLVTGAAMLVGTIGGGALGEAGLFIPFLVRAGLLAIVFGIASLTMRDIGYSPRPLKLADLPAEMGQVARASIQYGWRQRPVRLLILVSMIQMGFFAWGFYAWPPYFLELLGQDAVWVAGVISALVALSTMLGNGVVEWFSRYCGKRTTLLLWAAGVQTLAIIGIGVVDSFWLAVPLLLLAMAASGVTGPVQQAFTHQLIPSKQRATIISFGSMMGSAGSVVGQAGLGGLAEARSIGSGYLVGGAATMLALPVLLLLRRLNNPADAIIGTAGKSASCAAQGLPDIATVDTSVAIS